MPPHRLVPGPHPPRPASAHRQAARLAHRQPAHPAHRQPAHPAHRQAEDGRQAALWASREVHPTRRATVLPACGATVHPTRRAAVHPTRRVTVPPTRRVAIPPVHEKAKAARSHRIVTLRTRHRADCWPGTSRSFTLLGVSVLRSAPEPSPEPSPFGRGIADLSSSNPVGRQSQRRRSEEHTSELQSRGHLVCRLLHGKKKLKKTEFTLKNNDVRDFCVTTGDVTGYACAADRILISDVQFTEEVEIQGNRSDYESKHVN